MADFRGMPTMLMNSASIRVLAFAALNVASVVALAAPVSYSFTTGMTAYQGAVSGFAPGTPLPPLPLFGGVSGTFSWESAGSFVQINADGSSGYAGFTSPAITGLTPSISGLSATFPAMPGHEFSDPQGSTSVYNDNANNFFGSSIVGDALILAFDPPSFTGNQFSRNLSGGDIGPWHLYSARMLWIEGVVAKTDEFASPNLGVPIGDFLSDQALPGALPAFEGRLWLEFQNTLDQSQVLFVFYNNLLAQPRGAAIPEPETYALLLAALGLLGFQLRRTRN